MKSVLVLLSTYNGEKYIREQINSLINQTGVKVSILVRDDGSSDATINILSLYEKKGLISVLRGSNIGWKKSFMELLYSSSDADYYAFCDQDDIWMPNKLERAVFELEKISKDSPNLYGSNLRYYKDGVDMGVVRKQGVKVSLQSALISNFTAGCTMVFNKSLRDLIQNYPPQIDFPHDYWIYLVASLFGKVYYDDKSYILYRQHENNQIGASVSSFTILGKRIINLLDLIKPTNRQFAAFELLRLYKGKLSDEKKFIIEKVAFYNRSLKDRLNLLFDNKYSMSGWDSNIIVKLRILFGRL